MKILKFLVGLLFFSAHFSHAADTRVGFKNVYLHEKYSVISKNPALHCESTKNKRWFSSIPATLELRNLEKEVLERDAIIFSDKECVFKGRNTIAGLEIVDSTLRFYDERLMFVMISVSSKSPADRGEKEEAQSLYAPLIEGLSDKYGTPENKDFTDKERNVSRMLWTLESSHIYVDQEKSAGNIKIFFESNDYQRELGIRFKMKKKLLREEINYWMI